MSTIPIRRKRFLGLPVWFIPALIAIVLVTGWMALAGDDEPEVDVVEAGPANPPAYDAEAAPGDLGLPPDPPSGTSGMTVAPATGPDPATQAAIAAGSAAGAAAGAQASRAVLASVGDVGRTIRASAQTAGALSGRPVQIAGARVSEVLSDRAFTVGTGADRVMVLADPAGSGLPGVRVGQTVTVTGSLETYAPGMSESGIPDAGESGYVVVTRPGGAR